MSRLAKKPIAMPEKTTVTITGSTVTIKGPKGDLSRDFNMDVISMDNSPEGIKLALVKDDVFSRSLIGTYASHLYNMIEGVTKGYEKKLILEGVGYRMNLVGKKLDLALGFSHPVSITVPEGLTVTTEKNNMTIQGIDKELVGSFAAGIRALKKPEPYKGKGMRYHDEVILRKQGKKAA